ncbi:C-Jun-amino-terminal kinase-interacting protein 1a [Aplochiton taeniatus]
MESQEDGENWMEDQWEKWLTHDLSLEEFEDEDLSQVTEMTLECGASLHDQDNVTLWLANSEAGSEDGRRQQEEQWEGLRGMLHIELIDAEELHGGEREDQEVGNSKKEAKEEEDQGPVLARDPRLNEGKDEEEGERKAALPSVRLSAAVAMDTYRPKRPTTLALFAKVPQPQPQPQPQPPPQPRTQDTINNNSLEGKKETWKETNSSSPLITGDLTPTQERVRLKEKEDKVQHNGGPATKHRAKTHSITHTRAHAPADTHAPSQEKKSTGAPPAQPPRAPKSQRGGAGAGGAIMRDTASKDSGNMGAERSRSQQESHSRPEEEDFLGEKDRDCSLDGHQQRDEACLSPVVHRNKERPRLSRSSSEGGNRMSIGSDTEGPPGPPHAPLLDRANPSISEEDGEVDLYPLVTARSGKIHSTVQRPGKERGNTDCIKSGSRDGGTGRRTDRGAGMACTKSVSSVGSSVRTVPTSEATAGLSYDSVKYTLVVDEHSKLELVSLKDCYHSYSDEDSDTETVYQSANEDEDPDYEEDQRRRCEEKRSSGVAVTTRQSQVTSTSEEESSSGGGAASSRKFRNLFTRSHNIGVESFGLFSCVMNGVEKEQSHRAAFRFVPRHEDELELEPDDPLLMKAQDEDLWCQGYNMRTGTSGIFPAYYAVKVNQDSGKGHQDDGVDRFRVRFLGSAPVPFHKGNDVLCAAMQKIAINRRMAMQPPSACVLEISLKGVKISVQDECRTSERGDKCFHFFQLKNISFCGCHPKHNKYFGFITKHPDHHRFACHVVISEDTSMPLADSIGRAFKQYYKEHVGYSCPTEDIFID